MKEFTAGSVAAAAAGVAGADHRLVDRSHIHSRSGAVRAYLAKHPDEEVEDFPGYAPELNPDEHVWGRTKYGRPADPAADAQRLWDYGVEGLIDLKFRPDLLKSFIRKSGLPLPEPRVPRSPTLPFGIRPPPIRHGVCFVSAY